MNPELKNKVVLITGASGGIGSAIARQFAAEGAMFNDSTAYATHVAHVRRYLI